MATRPPTLRLYRNLLQSLKHYPSIKRTEYIVAVKEEFRIDALLTDAAAIEAKLTLANAELQRIARYASVDPDSADWSVKL